MNYIICKVRSCPRLVIYTETVDGKRYERRECNQHMPDSSVWWNRVKNVDKDRCRELREALKREKEVQG